MWFSSWKQDELKIHCFLNIAFPCWELLLLPLSCCMFTTGRRGVQETILCCYTESRWNWNDFPLFFPLIKWDIKDGSWFSITCVNGDREVFGWMYIAHQWLSAELTQFWAGATALCWAQTSPSRAGDDSASPGSGRRCWRTQNHLRVLVVLCHAVCSLLGGAGCISSPFTSVLFKRGSLKGCQDTAANCPDFHSTPLQSCCAVCVGHSLSAEVKDMGRVCCNPRPHKQGGLHRLWHESFSAVSLPAVACTASFFLLLRRWQTSASLLASDWFILLLLFLFLRTSWREC